MLTPTFATEETAWSPRETVLIPRIFVDAVVDMVWIPAEFVLMPRVFVDAVVDIV